MLGRIAAAAALIALASCAGMEPAGRTANREAPAPILPPARTQTLPPPSAQAQAQPSGPTQMPAPAPQPTQNQPPVAAPSVAAPPAPPPPPPQDPNEVVVQGAVPEQQVRPPGGDPRSVAERREDIRNWDHCVMDAMAQHSDPNSVETESPEDICARRLGQANRNAVPQSRLQQRPRP